MFLSSPADIAIYGGAAGGGKTWALLLEPLRHIKNGEFGGVIFRRLSPQITSEGGLWDESVKLFSLVGAEPKSGSLEWRFKSGSRIQFRHLQKETTVLNWQGSQIAYLGFDELTHFSEKQFFYMLSRNRSNCGVRPYIRATTNPAPGWVRSFLAPWLEHDHPYAAKPGEIRWFIRRDGKILWVDESFRDEEGLPAKSVTFIAASVYDNKILLQNDPGYLVNLKSLHFVEQQRLLYGNWNVFEGAFFAEFSRTAHLEATDYTPETLPRHWRIGGGLDWGYQSPFSFGLYGSDEDSAVHGLDEIYRTGLENTEQAQLIVAKLLEWKLNPREVPIFFDPTMKSKKRSPHGGVPKSDIEDFKKAGLRLIEGNNNHRHGYSQMRTFLHLPNMLKLSATRCQNLIKEFEEAKFSETIPEEMDEQSSDHALDQCRYFLMSRPKPAPPDPTVVIATEAEAKALLKEMNARREKRTKTRRTL